MDPAVDKDVAAPGGLPFGADALTPAFRSAVVAAVAANVAKPLVVPVPPPMREDEVVPCGKGCDGCFILKPKPMPNNQVGRIKLIY